jgi:hypothetical protein
MTLANLPIQKAANFAGNGDAETEWWGEAPERRILCAEPSMSQADPRR